MVMFGSALGPLQNYKSSTVVNYILIMSSCVFATTTGYDAGLLNGLNIMPSYSETLKLTAVLKSLNTSSSFLGWGFVSFFMGPTIDRIGRRSGVLLSIVLKLIGIALMSSAIDAPMFIVGRAILGAGSATSSIAASTWLAETLPSSWRASGLGFIYAVWYVGAFIAAGVCLGTSSIEGSWSWRLPSLLQTLWSFLCFFCLLFVPESPRWLVSRDRLEDALTVLASTHSDGNKDDAATLTAYNEIVDTLSFERESGQRKTYAQIFKTRNSRYRIALVVAIAVIAQASGNNIVSYFLGTMLTNAGITDSVQQLKINLVLWAWSFVLALIGTHLVNYVGRKRMLLVSTTLMTIFIFVIGALTKVYGSGSKNTSGIYGTVASIYLFQGSYAVGITPLTLLYPPEVLNYAIRSNGMAVWTMTTTLAAIFALFAWPLALIAIGWKSYMINGAWNIIQVLFVAYFFVETKNLTLEEIDGVFDGKKYSDAHDIEDLGKMKVLDGVTLHRNARASDKTGKAAVAVTAAK